MSIADTENTLERINVVGVSSVPGRLANPGKRNKFSTSGVQVALSLSITHLTSLTV